MSSNSPRLFLLALLLFPLAGNADDVAPASALQGLVQLLESSEDGLTGLPFAEVVLATTGHTVRPVNPTTEANHLRAIEGAIARAVERINQGGHAFQAATRINEASGPIEEEILRQFALEPAWKAEFAPTADGKIQRAGYPDLRLQAPDGLVYYLDPKLIQENNRQSSFRTFYYEPRRETGKINDDAAHLLVGFMHNEAPGAARRILAWDLVDVAAMPVRLKAEFQASNREIYRPEAILHRATVTPPATP